MNDRQEKGKEKTIAIFNTKLVRDELYQRNGEEVEIIGPHEFDKNFIRIRFVKDNLEKDVYESEVKQL